MIMQRAKGICQKNNFYLRSNNVNKGNYHKLINPNT